MYERFTHINKYVIFFILIGFLIFIGTIFLIGNKREWFQPKIRLFTLLTETNGIKPGTPILISGIQVGIVTDIFLNDANMVSCEMKINRKFQNRIGIQSRAIVKSQTLIGNKIIEITIDKSKNERITSDSYIHGIVQQDVVSFLLKPEIFQLEGKNLLSELRNITKEIDAISREFSGAVKRSERTFEEMGEAAIKVNQIATDLTKKDTVNNIKDAISNMKKLVINLEATNSLTQDKIDIAFGEISGILSKTDALISNMNVYSKNIPEILKSTNEILVELRNVVHAMEKHWLLKKYIKEVKEEKK